MKIFFTIFTCFLVLLPTPGSLFCRTTVAEVATNPGKRLFEDTGIIMSAADFWIGIPDDHNAMPFLKISQGTRVRILELEKKYYKIEHRNMVGYVRKELVKVIEPELSPDEPEELVSRGPEPARTPPPAAKTEKASANPAETLSYSLTQATSLRAQPDSQARVILRFAPGDEVEVLESTNKYWWKVRFRGETGWAKSALLKKQ